MNHKMRIVAFVGSPLEVDSKELVKVAKRLKKEKVNVDLINFGEEQTNTEKLTEFINTINGREGTGSHLVTVPPGPHLLSDILLNSPVIITEGEIPTGGGPHSTGGFDFGTEAQNDPELMMALRMSMEEEQRRLEKARLEKGDKSEPPKQQPTSQPPSSQNLDKMDEEMDEDAMLQEAIKLSMLEKTPAPTKKVDTKQQEYDQDLYDDDEVDEEEALRLAMELSKKQPEKDEKISDILADEDFMNSIIDTLPKDEKKDKKEEKK